MKKKPIKKFRTEKPLTKEEFEKTLKKVSRKIKSSEPDSKES